MIQNGFMSGFLCNFSLSLSLSGLFQYYKETDGLELNQEATWSELLPLLKGVHRGLQNDIQQLLHIQQTHWRQ